MTARQEGVPTVYVGSSDRNIYALDAETGEERWRHRTTGPVMSSLVVVDGRVYVGNVSGRLYAVEVDGEPAWTFEAGQEDRQGVELSAAITGSPVVCDGTVYVGSMYPGDALAGRLLAVAADGTLYFGAPTFGPLAGRRVGGYAVDTVDERRWRFPVADRHEGFGSSPAVVDSMLYIGEPAASLRVRHLVRGRRIGPSTSRRAGDEVENRRTVVVSPDSSRRPRRRSPRRAVPRWLR